MDKKGKLDIMLSKLLSRKLLVWVTATAALFVIGPDFGDNWTSIALAYLGVEGLADIATRFKAGIPKGD